MTREEFDNQVGFKEVLDADGNLTVTGGINLRASKMIARKFVSQRDVMDHVKSEIKHELWHIVYGNNRRKFVEKLIALRRISFPSDFKECDRIYNEIYELLKGL